MSERTLPARNFFFTYFVGHQRSKTDGFKKIEKKNFRAERSLSDIFSKKNLVHDVKWKILRWPPSFEPLGQAGSHGPSDRESP